MKYRRWNIANAPEDAVNRLMESGFPSLLSSVLASRGVFSAEDASIYLDQDQLLQHSPMLLKDMDKAVRRIE